MSDPSQATARAAVAVITGISGQDGSYLAEMLLADDANVKIFGMVRRTSANVFRERLDVLESHPRVRLVYGDMTDASSIRRLLDAAVAALPAGPPDSDGPWLDVYNLAAQSHVKVSFETPCYTAETDAFGVLSMLETILQYPRPTRDRIRFYQASTSEMFGSSPSPQNEDTPFHPRSPYGVAKLYAHWIVRNYRESYGLKACSGILFNHESERRGLNFVTHKVTQAVARYSLYLAKLHAPPDEADTSAFACAPAALPTPPAPLAVGNLEARRDWGYAPDYVRAMITMTRKAATDPQDYVIATGVSHTIRELVDFAFSAIGVVVVWEGAGLAERGYDAASRELLVTVDERYFRPAEVADLLGDASRAAAELFWRPTVTFSDMIVRMVRADIAAEQRAEAARI